MARIFIDFEGAPAWLAARYGGGEVAAAQAVMATTAGLAAALNPSRGSTPTRSQRIAVTLSRSRALPPNTSRRLRFD